MAGKVESFLKSELEKKNALLFVLIDSEVSNLEASSKLAQDVEKIGALADYNILGKEDKKTTKIFTKCFKNKESYKELLKKLPKNIDRLGIFYLILLFFSSTLRDMESTFRMMYWK